MSRFTRFFKLSDTRSQSGQALILVVMALVVALAVTVSVAVRTLSSVSRVSRTDTLSRVTAAAEGGAERFLNAPDAVLLALSSGADSTKCSSVDSAITFDSATSSCVVKFDNGVGPDAINSKALVTVSPYPASGGDHAEFKIKKNEVVEITLNKSVNSGVLCWKPSVTGTKANLFYSGYGDGSTTNSWLVKNGLCPPSGSGGCAGNGSGTNLSGAGWVSASLASNTACTGAGYTFEYDFAPNALKDIVGLRVRSLVADSDMMFVGSGALPLQGFTINSTGVLATSSAQETMVVKVVRTLEFLPALFDYEIYSPQALPR